MKKKHERRPANTHTASRRSVWRAELSCPGGGGGCTRSAGGLAAVCVWRTGGPSPGFGAFSSSPYSVPLCWVWGPGIAGVLWSCHEGVVRMCDSVRLLFFFFFLPRRYDGTSLPLAFGSLYAKSNGHSLTSRLEYTRTLFSERV